MKEMYNMAQTTTNNNKTKTAVPAKKVAPKAKKPVAAKVPVSAKSAVKKSK
jgi:hypothetical protein